MVCLCCCCYMRLIWCPMAFMAGISSTCDGRCYGACQSTAGVHAVTASISHWCLCSSLLWRASRCVYASADGPWAASTLQLHTSRSAQHFGMCTSYSQHCIPMSFHLMPSVQGRKLEWLGYKHVKVAWWSTQVFGHNTLTWQTLRQPRRLSNSRLTHWVGRQK